MSNFHPSKLQKCNQHGCYNPRDGGDDDDDVDVDDGIDIDVIRRPMRCVDGGLDHYTKT